VKSEGFTEQTTWTYNSDWGPRKNLVEKVSSTSSLIQQSLRANKL